MHRLIRSFIGGFSRNISLTTNLKNSPTTSISSTSNAPQKTSTYSTLPTPSPSDSVIASQPTDVGKVHRYDRVNYGYPTKTAAELLKLPYDQQFPENAIVVYTDASCVRQSATGIANYYGNSHPLNLSLRLNLQEHSSGKAEIYSTTIALHRLFYWKEYRGELVIIRTDYLATICAMRYGNNGSFAMDYDNLRSVAAYFPLGVEFQWVKAHNGDPGNEMADKMAKKAIERDLLGRSNSMQPQGSNRSRTRSRSRRRVRSNSSFLNDTRKRRCQSRATGNCNGERVSRIDTFDSVDSSDSGYSTRNSSRNSIRSISSEGRFEDWPNGERRVLIKGGMQWNEVCRPKIEYPHPTPIIPYLNHFSS